jgi:hypothetical protein
MVYRLTEYYLSMLFEDDELVKGVFVAPRSAV